MSLDNLSVLSLFFFRLPSFSGVWSLEVLELHHNSFLQKSGGKILNSPSMRVKMKFPWSALDLVLLVEHTWGNVRVKFSSKFKLQG